MGRTGESRRRRRRVSAARGFRVTLSVAALAVASASLARVWIRTVVAGEGWRWRSCVSSNDACRRTCRIKLSEFVTTAGDRVPFYSWVSGSLCGADWIAIVSRWVRGCVGGNPVAIYVSWRFDRLYSTWTGLVWIPGCSDLAMYRTFGMNGTGHIPADYLLHILC